MIIYHEASFLNANHRDVHSAVHLRLLWLPWTRSGGRVMFEEENGQVQYTRMWETRMCVMTSVV